MKTCGELVIDLLAAGIQENDLGDKVFARLDVLIHNTAGSTGKSLSEALIFASTNPHYNDRLFIELPVQYMKTTSSEHQENILCT